MISNAVRSGNDLFLELSNASNDVTNIVVGGHYAGQAVEALALDDEVILLATGFSGSDFADLIAGTSGSDIIDGGANHDGLFGGAGDDTLIGGAGDDFMAGGSGADVFAFNSLDDILHVQVNQSLSSIFGSDSAPIDKIGDFSGVDDLLQFDGTAFSAPSLSIGGFLQLSINFSVIVGSFDGTSAGTNTNFGAGNGTFVYSQSDEVLYYDDNGSSAGYYAVAAMDEPGAGDIHVGAFPAG